MPIRVALADDHPIVLQGLQQLFARHEDFHVCCLCASGDEALDCARTQALDVLVLDLRMPDRNGLDVLRAIAAEQLTCLTVFLTAAISEDEVVEAVRLGVRGVILKDSSPDALLDGVRRVARGELILEPEIVARAARARASAGGRPPVSLTPREVDIVRMVARGLRNRAIAEQLSISEGTVKVHLHNIYEKFNVDGRLALLLSAKAKGII